MGVIYQRLFVNMWQYQMIQILMIVAVSYDLRSSNDILRLDVPIPKRIVGESAFLLLVLSYGMAFPKISARFKISNLLKKQLKTHLFPKD